MSGMISVSGMVKSSPVMPMSRSISISMSAAIVNGQFTDSVETSQVAYEAGAGELTVREK